MKLESFHEEDNKKRFIIVFTVMCIALVVGVFLYHSYAWYEDEKTFNSFSGNVNPVGDIYFAVYVNNVASENVPAKDTGYNFDHAECTNSASLTWDNTTWSAKVNNLTSTRTKCTLYFAEDRSAASVIARLSGNADPTSTALIDNGTDASGCTNTLAYDDFGNLRFVGANPCNYVTFNGESWRIIGVIDNKLKIIRMDSIGSYSWDSSASGVNGGHGINQWGESGTYTGSDIMKLLNPGFEENISEDSSGNAITGTYASNSLYWNRASGNCYAGVNNLLITCDFTGSGLTENARNMVAYSTWYVGSEGENDVNGSGMGTAKKFYEYERSTNTGKNCTSGQYCNDAVNRTTIWEGFVGLMSPSDYGYAVGGNVRNTCLANVNLSEYNNNNCYANDWLVDTSSSQLTISPSTHSTSASAVQDLYEDGCLLFSDARYRNNVRPTVYLKSVTIITDGLGTSNNPYTLSAS